MPAYETSGFPLVATYSSNDRGDDHYTYCATQDQAGVMYFGSDVLLAFNGEHWSKTSIPGSTAIRALAVGKDGKLWVGAYGDIGWFDRSPNNTLAFHSLKTFSHDNDIPASEILRVFATNDGAVFIGIDRILRWNGASLERFDMPGTRTLTGVQLGKTIYVHYRSKGLYILEKSGPRLLIPQSAIGSTDTAIGFIDNEFHGGMLIATTNGLITYKNGKSNAYSKQVSQLINDNVLNCATRLPNGDYAFGTMKGGIITMHPDGTLGKTITFPRNLPINFVTSLFIDRQGSLWVTSPTHILRYDQTTYTTVFDERANLPQQRYYALAKASDNIIAASTSGNFELHEGDHTFSRSPSSSEIVHDLVTTPAGIVAAGFRSAWLINGNKKTEIHSSNRDVFALTPSQKPFDDYCFAETDRIVTQTPGHKERIIIDHLEQVPTSIVQLKDGSLMVGTMSGGALRIAATASSAQYTITRVPEITGHTVVRKSNNDTLLVLSEEGAWIQEPNTQHLTRVLNYPNEQLLATSNIVKNKIWVALKKNDNSQPYIGQIAIGNDSASWQPIDIFGLESVGTPAAILAEANDKNPVLWIAGTNCVLRCNIDYNNPASAPPAPTLSVTAEFNDHDGAQAVNSQLPYNTHAINFEFSDPDFIRRPLIHIETKIKGIDSDWVPAGKDSRRELTAIRDGKYTFQVRAVANTGAVSEPTVFKFEVAPPWWRTNGAIAGEVAALGLMIFGGYRWRVQTLRKRNAQLEAKVKERTEELAEASAAKTMFVANMSHDIRNPLNGIVGLALALEQTKLDGKQREIIATLRECTTYLSSLVDDVLDFASIEAGRVELRMGPFVPSDLLNSIVTALKAEAADKGALITIETDPDLPPMLRGDAGRIQQILVNYLSNALKYAGGHIRVAASLAPSSTDEIEFSVADEGAGLSDEEQKTLFTKFGRLDSARRAEIKGSGLGLASCRALADIMGGSVGVESKLGQGSRFFLRLPLEVATEVAPQVATDIALPRTSVLLVEDTDYNAMAATAVLAKLGLTCDRAKNGEEAVRLFAEERHSVVLLDRNLPDMDGTEVAQKMRELESDGNRSLLLAVTAYCTAEDRQLCLKSGMDAFVGKPLTPEKLRKVLLDAARQMLGTSSIEAAPEATIARAEPAAAAATDAAPELDTKLLEYLSDGTPSGIAAQTERFIAEMAEAQAQLVAAKNASPTILGDAAHRVLGQGRMVGATALCEAAARLETAARKSDAATVAAAFPIVSAEVANLTAALRCRPGVRQA